MMKLGMLMALADQARRSVQSPNAEASWEGACYHAPLHPTCAALFAEQCIKDAHAARLTAEAA